MIKRTSTQPSVLRILSSLGLGMFLAALDTTVMSTAALTISQDFGHVSSQNWLLTSYLLAALITTPIYGRESDRWGRRPLFLIALVLFGLGSLLAAIAPSFLILVVARTIQGLGAGGLFSLAFAVIADILAPRERGRYILFFVVIFGSSSILGPLIGGIIAAQERILGISGWRWIFIINVPLVLIALVRALMDLHTKQEFSTHRFDYLGVALLGLSILALLLGVQVIKMHAFELEQIFLASIFIVSFVAFVLVERRRRDDALIPIHFFRNRLFRVTVMSSAVSGAGMLVAIALVPLSIQIVHFKSAAMAGVILLAAGVGNLLGSGIGSRALSNSNQDRWLMTSGLTFMSAGFIGLAIMENITNSIISLTLIGVGSGLITQFTSVVAPSALGNKYRGAGSSLNTFFRQLGGLLGVGLSLAIVFLWWKVPENFASSNLATQMVSISKLMQSERLEFATALKPIYVTMALFLLFMALLSLSLPKAAIESNGAERK